VILGLVMNQIGISLKAQRTKGLQVDDQTQGMNRYFFSSEFSIKMFLQSVESKPIWITQLKRAAHGKCEKAVTQRTPDIAQLATD